MEVGKVTEIEDMKKLGEMDSMQPTKVFKDIFPYATSSSGVGTASSVNGPSEAKDNLSINQCLKSERERHERELQNLRQKLIHELDGLHEREKQERFEIEQTRSHLMLEREMVEMEKQKLKMKEQHIEEEVNVKVKLQTEKLLSEYKMKEAETWGNKIKEQQQWFEEELLKVRRNSVESDHLKAQLSHMEKSYKTLENEYAFVLTENEKLKTKLREMSDYSSIKEELCWRSKKLEICEQEILNLKSEIQSEKGSSLSTIQKLQHQLRIATQRHSLESVNQNYNAPKPWSGKIEKEHQDMKKVCSTVLERLEEQKGDIHELHKMIHNLYNALEKMKSQDLLKSSVGKEPSAVKGDDGNFLSEWNVASKNAVHQDAHKSNSNYEEPLNFINKAKKQISMLHKESEALGQKYTEYLSTITHLMPKMPLPYDIVHPDTPYKSVYQPFDTFYFSELDTKYPVHESFIMPSGDGLIEDDFPEVKSPVTQHYEFESKMDSFTLKPPHRYDRIFFDSGSQFVNEYLLSKTQFEPHMREMTDNGNFTTYQTSATGGNSMNMVPSYQKSDSVLDQDTQKLVHNENQMLMSRVHSISHETSNSGALNHNYAVSNKEVVKQISEGNKKKSEINELEMLPKSVSNLESAEQSALGQVDKMKNSFTASESINVAKDDPVMTSANSPNQQASKDTAPTEEIRIVPFQKLRRISLTPPAGLPVIDLNEAWRKHKSSVEPSNCTATSSGPAPSSASGFVSFSPGNSSKQPDTVISSFENMGDTHSEQSYVSSEKNHEFTIIAPSSMTSAQDSTAGSSQVKSSAVLEGMKQSLSGCDESKSAAPVGTEAEPKDSNNSKEVANSNDDENSKNPSVLSKPDDEHHSTDSSSTNQKVLDQNSESEPEQVLRSTSEERNIDSELSDLNLSVGSIQEELQNDDDDELW